jgi:flagellar biogenesis protein FliO
MTIRRDFFRCVMAFACCMAWVPGLCAQVSNSRTRSIDEIEADFEQSARPSPFYDDPEPQARSSTVRRESTAEIELTEPELPVRQKTPLPTSDFADEEESVTASRSSFGPSLFWSFGILAVGWIARQYIKGGGALPGRSSGSLELLSRQTLGPQQQLALIRLGSKILLVGATPSGMSTLTTIEDPAEVARLMAELRPAATQTRPTWKDLFRAPQAEPREQAASGVSISTMRRPPTTNSAPSVHSESDVTQREVADV